MKERKNIFYYLVMFFVGALITAIGILFINKNIDLFTGGLITLGGIIAATGRFLFQSSQAKLNEKKHLELLENQNKLTGGDSFVSISVFPSSYGLQQIMFTLHGEHPIEIVGFNVLYSNLMQAFLDECKKKGITPGASIEITGYNYNHSIHLKPKLSKIVTLAYPITFIDKEENKIIFRTETKSKNFRQETILKKENDKWVAKLQVTDRSNGKVLYRKDHNEK